MRGTGDRTEAMVRAEVQGRTKSKWYAQGAKTAGMLDLFAYFLW